MQSFGYSEQNLNCEHRFLGRQIFVDASDGAIIVMDNLKYVTVSTFAILGFMGSYAYFRETN